jgi:hypothetical protein
MLLFRTLYKKDSPTGSKVEWSPRSQPRSVAFEAASCRSKSEVH